ncbi:MAG: hypothetical protein ISN28_04640 [Ectothiorhodospiraceae bacterium AqS1]|nr:hypothetical protein [Ectothiorhodospiraceae bacterium AqS1]
MIVSKIDLDAIQSHWAIATISAGDRRLAFDLVKERTVNCIVGCEFEFEFQEDEGNDTSDERKKDDGLIDSVALAHEIAVIEGLDALARPDRASDPSGKQSAAASYRLFDIWRLKEIPKDMTESIYHVLRLSALAHFASRETDLRQWFEENPLAIKTPSVAGVSWDRRLLYRLFDCWIRLLRKKNDRSDIDHIEEIIAGLREEQDSHEEAYLAKKTGSRAQAMTLHLISLYHWTKATEILAGYMRQGKPWTILEDLDRHFQSSIKAAIASGDMDHEINLRWLRAAGGAMVANSPWRIK